MKTRSAKHTRFHLLLGLAFWAAGSWASAQNAPTLEIALYPGIRVTGEVGTTYVIETKTEVEGDFWLTRGWIELTTPTAIWMDPVPTDAPRRVYRAVKVIKPVVQTIPNMVWIPPGRFMMGSPETERGRWDSEGPQMRVTLTKGFWMGKYEVTQGEYLAVMGNNPSWFNGDPKRPVETVSWEDATNYCAKLTELERAAGRLATGYAYRLPTEAQWEYACRAGTTTRYSFGDALACDDFCGWCALFDSNMWWCGNARDQTHPAGQKLPNPWGLYDLHGNVWEWCQDWWSNNLPGGSVIDPTGPATSSSRVIRGGHWGVWNSGSVECRSAHHGGFYPDSGISLIGFRVLLAPGQ